MRRVEDSLNRAFIALFRHWVATVSIVAALLVAGAVVTPVLASRDFGAVAQLLYWMYRPLCPQRPEHSFFIAGHKMAFEQRETAMFLVGALAGPAYVCLKRTRLRVPGWLVFVAVSPMFVDVATQVINLRESDGFWRSLTGGLAVLSFALWAYPKLDADLSQPLTTVQTEAIR